MRSSARQPRWRLAAAVAGTLLFACVATASALDRASVRNPALAARIPSLLASQAVLASGQDAIAAGQTEQAERLGKAAVAKAPVDPASSALLGAAWLAMNRQSDADKAFRVAGQLGWRILFTQAYWLDRALRDGDYRLAALRLDALLRQNPELAQQRALFDPVERNPAGRSALIDRMLTRPGWVPDYATRIAALPPDAVRQRAGVLDEAGNRGIHLGCAAAAPATARLLSMGAAAEAARLYRLHCPLANGLLTDGDLTALSSDPPPVSLDWQLVGDSQVSTGIEPAAGGPGQRLRIESTASWTRPVLVQGIVVPAGRYRVSWSALDDADRPKAGFAAAIGCNTRQPVYAPGTFSRSDQRWQADLTVDGSCAVHTLQLGVLPGAGAVWLQRVRLEPLD